MLVVRAHADSPPLSGRDWVLDSTLMDAFSAHDSQAGWSFSKRFGHKVHLLICRERVLPIMFLVSPANRNDAPGAVPLMALALPLFPLPVRVVRAAAAYFTRPILAFITGVLRATPLLAFNPRKRGKKGPVTHHWAAEERRNRGKRGYIERFFAVLKRYFRLNHLQAPGARAAYHHAFEVCLAVLLVAWLADSLGRPDLIHARSRILTPC
ncbi:MAG: transposase [Chloroflexota bacterium]